MASTFQINADAQNAMCNALVDRLDLGGDAATLRFHKGAEPASCAAADTSTPLAILPMTFPAAFGDAVAGVATADTITPTAAIGSGECTHFRCRDSIGVTVFQGSAGLAASDPDAVFDDPTIVALGLVSVTLFTVTVPASKE